MLTLSVEGWDQHRHGRTTLRYDTTDPTCLLHLKAAEDYNLGYISTCGVRL
jgi:hypothetical protein